MLKKRNILALGFLATLVVLVSIGTAAAGGHQLSADLSDENSVPPIVGTAVGSAIFTFDQGSGQVCFVITTNGLSSAIIADHIHQAPAGVNGGVVVNFGGALNGCVAAAPALIGLILLNPEEYYLNVHTANFNGGEMRGQLQPFTPVGGTTSFLTDGSGSSYGSILLAAGIAAVVAISAGGWFTRRRWLRS